MSRKIEKIKGFAMSELLAVCVVVLLIFAILFANYLPLLAEYEVRISYNNVTAQYAAHYVRAVYKEILEHSNATGVITQIDTAVVDEQNRPKSYIKVYNPDIENINNQEIVKHINSVYGNGTATSNAKINDLKQILAEYGIEEIVISTYKTSGLKEKYENGKMEKYIKYLPKYDRSIYTGEDADNQKQLYRITIKTKEFGYASTPILTDGLTPDECLILNEKNSASHGNYFEVVGYHSEKQQCSENVVIGDGKYSNGSKKLVIKSIGAGAFSTNTEKYTNAKSENIKIESISIPKQVVSIGNGAFQGLTNLTSYKILSENITIGDYAFSNTGITSFNMRENNQDIGNVTKIGEYAFANNEKLTTINVKANITYGENVFSNNSTLTTIKFENESGDTINIVEKMFVNCGNSESGISLTIPNNFKEKVCIRTDKETSNETKVNLSDCSNSDTDDYTYEIKELGDTISDYMFNQTNISSLTIGNQITTIGQYAFAQTAGKSSGSGNGEIQELEIPTSIKTIDIAAFKNLPIETAITFSEPSNLETIGKNSFEMLKISDDTTDETGNKKTNQDNSIGLTIPKSVKTIGTSAFNLRKLSDVKFAVNDDENAALWVEMEKDSDLWMQIEQGAFSNNNISSLKMPRYVKFNYTTSQIVMIEGIFSSNKNLIIDSWPKSMKYIEAGISKGSVIPPKCFAYTKGNENLTIPAYITEIGHYAFDHTTSIKEINFKCNDNESLKINDYAFRYSTKLDAITLPSNTTSIGKQALLNDKTITVNNYSSIMKSSDWCNILSDKSSATPSYTCEETSTGVNMTYKDGGITTTRIINHITTGEGGCVQ